MGILTLAAYKPTPATPGDANQIANGFTAIEASVNSIAQSQMAAGNKVTASAMSGGPPASPTDGDIWIALNVDASGTTWKFRYNGGSASSLKWEFIGGAPVFSEVATGEATASAGFTDLATVGPQIILARAGDYAFSWGAGAFAVGANTAFSLGLIQSGVGEVVRAVSTIGAGNTSMNASRSTKATMPAAADMRVQYAVTANTTFDRRWMSVVPVRIS